MHTTFAGIVGAVPPIFLGPVAPTIVPDAVLVADADVHICVVPFVIREKVNCFVSLDNGIFVRLTVKFPVVEFPENQTLPVAKLSVYMFEP
jgi:hypothetical protein